MELGCVWSTRRSDPVELVLYYLHVSWSCILVVAAAIKELRQTARPFMACMVRHYTMIAVSQQSGGYSW